MPDRSRWRRRTVRAVAAMIAVAVVVLSSPQVARAADGEPGQGQALARPLTDLPTSPDFLLRNPRAWIGIRGSMLFPRAGGDLFAFVTHQLTLDKRDLRARGVAGDVGIILTPTLDIVGGVDLSRREAGSEYRRLVASDRTAIEQRTRLNQTSVSAGVRYSPLGRGRRISRFAYIPRRVAPYAGAGITGTFYAFSQHGQFVDYVDYSIFSDQFTSSGWTMGPYVNGGVDVQVWKALYVTFDGRFTWIHADLSRDFSGFDGIDLAGFRGGTGISVLF